jgi:hypothetical protein
MMSTWAAILATTAGWRYVLPSTIVPTRIRGTSAASALSVLHDSSIAPPRSLVLGMKWSVTHAMSQPDRSRCCHSSSTPDQVCAPMLVNRPKRISVSLSWPRAHPANVQRGSAAAISTSGSFSSRRTMLAPRLMATAL